MREFDTGATRDNNEDKHNYEGFLSPLVIEEFGRYMHRHRHQADGKVRDGDNWQKGIPTEAYMDSLLLTYGYITEDTLRGQGSLSLRLFVLYSLMLKVCFTTSCLSRKPPPGQRGSDGRPYPFSE
jgi:hypothetical protein